MSDDGVRTEAARVYAAAYAAHYPERDLANAQLEHALARLEGA